MTAGRFSPNSTSKCASQTPLFGEPRHPTEGCRNREPPQWRTEAAATSELGAAALACRCGTRCIRRLGDARSEAVSTEPLALRAEPAARPLALRWIRVECCAPT